MAWGNIIWCWCRYILHYHHWSLSLSIWVGMWILSLSTLFITMFCINSTLLITSFLLFVVLSNIPAFRGRSNLLCRAAKGWDRGLSLPCPRHMRAGAQGGCSPQAACTIYSITLPSLIRAAPRPNPRPKEKKINFLIIVDIAIWHQVSTRR